MSVPLTDRALVERFIRVSWHVHACHRRSSPWVPPLLVERRQFLNPRRNPFFDHADAAFWIARRGGRDLGRIAAVDDADWQACRKDGSGTFGMLETVDDATVPARLLERAAQWLSGRDLTSMVGPFDLSSNHVSGILVDGYDDEPSINMPFNPPYYERLLLECGLEKEMDLWQWRLGVQPPPLRVAKLAERVRRRERIHVRTMRMTEWDAEVDRLLEIYNEAWRDNWAFVPLRRKEIHHLARELKLVVRPELALMVEVDGRPVGFALAVVDVNPLLKPLDGRLARLATLRLLWTLKVRRGPKFGRLMLLGIRDSHRGRGIDVLLFVELMAAAARLGWEYGEIGWTAENNRLVNRAVEAMGARRTKTYRVFRSQLSRHLRHPTRV